MYRKNEMMKIQVQRLINEPQELNQFMILQVISSVVAQQEFRDLRNFSREILEEYAHLKEQVQASLDICGGEDTLCWRTSKASPSQTEALRDHVPLMIPAIRACLEILKAIGENQDVHAMIDELLAKPID